MSTPERIPPELVKKLREETGAGMMDCKRALIETGGDFEKARDLLRTRGLASAQKRAGRTASEGLVDAYIHGEGRIGVLVEINCETDFVARTEEFRRLAREVAMQIAALNPRWISRDEVPPDVIDGERKIYEERARGMGRPEKVIPQIVNGMLEAFYKEEVLLDQDYVREHDRTIADLVTEVASKVGENVVIRRFVRFELGRET
ncbi:MAG TPA: translation elongation factor Ts [Actinomycetota bacterium]|jgi:elongation factor Ts|nr:translation elongation factor Ts [Actinomycetota bacterium]